SAMPSRPNHRRSNRQTWSHLHRRPRATRLTHQRSASHPYEQNPGGTRGFRLPQSASRVPPFSSPPPWWHPHRPGSSHDAHKLGIESWSCRRLPTSDARYPTKNLTHPIALVRTLVFTADCIVACRCVGHQEPTAKRTYSGFGTITYDWTAHARFRMI